MEFVEPLTLYFSFVGRVYCQLKTTAERNASQWVIGENDICFITRKLGIIIIEVKGRHCLIIVLVLSKRCVDPRARLFPKNTYYCQCEQNSCNLLIK